jgi:hypothetical protein
MGRSYFVDAANARYARLNSTEKARHDLEQSMPYRQVFSRKQFPTAAAWARFLTLRCALDERSVGTPLPEKHIEKLGANVLDAREDKERALSGVARCTVVGCRSEGLDVERYAISYFNGVESEQHLCPSCARWLTIDPMFGCANVKPYPIDG